MRTRVLNAMVVCLICLGPVACLRSLDNNKIPCTKSDHCPSQYTCVAGYCKRASEVDGGHGSDAASIGDGPRSERGDVGLATQPDSATPTLNPDAYLPSTGGVGDAALGGTSGGSGTIGTGGASGSTGTGGTTAAGGIATGGLLATSGGTAATGNTSGIGGMTITNISVATGGATLTTSTAVTGGSTGAGGKGGATGGATSSGGTNTSVGSSSTVTGGASSGGVSASGGSSSAVTGGSSATSSATCQPKPRDCTSTLDNNCNGIPDNQETSSCACPVGQKRACLEHPGSDGKGPCKAGSQTCQASSDKTTSTWNDCSGAVAPSTEVCDAAGVDENCDGQSNEGCECVNGTSIPCDCGPATTCTNGRKGTCSVSKVQRYRDFDGDNHGDPAQPTQVCPGTAGYVSSSDDCDDRNSALYPSMSICSSATQSKSCSSAGVTSNTTCDYGCAGAGQCHPAADGTIGLPGYVSCTNVSNCLAGDGCLQWDSSGLCGTTGSGGVIIHCDGPNDCPGQKCLMYMDRTINEAKCYAAVPSDNPDAYAEVCDPMANTCQAPKVCTKQGLLPLYECQ